jgi:hypothetical protein
MVINIAAEIDRIDKKIVELQAVRTYLASLTGNDAENTPPQSQQKLTLKRRKVSEPSYGPGLQTLVQKFIKDNPGSTTQSVIKAIRADYPAAPPTSIRSEIYRARQKGRITRNADDTYS